MRCCACGSKGLMTYRHSIRFKVSRFDILQKTMGSPQKLGWSFCFLKELAPSANFHNETKRYTDYSDLGNSATHTMFLCVQSLIPLCIQANWNTHSFYIGELGLNVYKCDSTFTILHACFFVFTWVSKLVIVGQYNLQIVDFFSLGIPVTYIVSCLSLRYTPYMPPKLLRWCCKTYLCSLHMPFFNFKLIVFMIDKVGLCHWDWNMPFLKIQIT